MLELITLMSKLRPRIIDYIDYPGGNTIATAELTFTHMLCGTRPIVRGASGMKEGKWERKLFKRWNGG